MYKNKSICFILLLIFLSSCVETVVVSGIAAGAYVASDSNIKIFDKNRDLAIQTTIEKSLEIEERPEEFEKVDVKVFNNKVMLTGSVKNEKYKKITVNKSNAILSNISVIDEIIVVDKNSKLSSMLDSFISMQISVKLRFAKNIRTSNYRYNVVNGSVYIIGQSDNSNEINKTTKIISEIKGVKKVVSYIVLA